MNITNMCHRSYYYRTAAWSLLSTCAAPRWRWAHEWQRVADCVGIIGGCNLIAHGSSFRNRRGLTQNQSCAPTAAGAFRFLGSRERRLFRHNRPTAGWRLKSGLGGHAEGTLAGAARLAAAMTPIERRVCMTPQAPSANGASRPPPFPLASFPDSETADSERNADRRYRERGSPERQSERATAFDRDGRCAHRDADVRGGDVERPCEARPLRRNCHHAHLAEDERS